MTWGARAVALAAGALLAGAAVQGSAHASDGNVDSKTTVAAPAEQQEGNSTEGLDESTGGLGEGGAEGFSGSSAASQGFQQGG